MDQQGVSNAERRLIAAALAALALFWVCAELRHPGFGFYDEEGLISKLQFHAEGQPLPWGLFRFTFWHRLLALVAEAAPGNVLALRLPALLLLLAECWLLHDVVGRRLGSRAAAWAVAFDLLAAFTLIRSRSMLPWAATPAWTLGLLAWMDRARESRLSMALCGTAAAAFLLEYEAWPMSGVWLALEAWKGPAAGKGRSAFFAGAMTGLGLVAALTWSQWAEYLHTRVALSDQPDAQPRLWRIATNLTPWVWPHSRIGFLGPDAHPLLPPWAMAGVALGAVTLWRRWPAVLAAAAVGLLPAVSHYTVEEPNRYIAAWVAVCAVAGAGLSRLSARRWPRALVVVALLGGAWEWAAADASLGMASARTFSQSLQWRSAARRLAETAPAEGWELISGLGRGDDAAFRFLCRGAGVPFRPQGRPVAMLNWEYLPAVRAWGLSFDPRPTGPERSCALLHPGKGLSAVLKRDAAFLAPLHYTLEARRPPSARAAVRLAAVGYKQADPLVRTVLAEMDFILSAQLGDLEPERVMNAVTGPLVSANLPWWMAQRLEGMDPQAAAVYAKIALKVDPRRMEASDLIKRVDRRKGP